jgi:hypothetical protein
MPLAFIFIAVILPMKNRNYFTATAATIIDIQPPKFFRALSVLMESEPGSSFLFEHDFFRPSFARRSGLHEDGKPVPTFPESA